MSFTCRPILARAADGWYMYRYLQLEYMYVSTVQLQCVLSCTVVNVDVLVRRDVVLDAKQHERVGGRRRSR